MNPGSNFWKKNGRKSLRKLGKSPWRNPGGRHRKPSDGIFEGIPTDIPKLILILESFSKGIPLNILEECLKKSRGRPQRIPQGFPGRAFEKKIFEWISGVISRRNLEEINKEISRRIDQGSRDEFLKESRKESRKESWEKSRKNVGFLERFSGRILERFLEESQKESQEKTLHLTLEWSMKKSWKNHEKNSRGNRWWNPSKMSKKLSREKSIKKRILEQIRRIAILNSRGTSENNARRSPGRTP